MERITNFIKTYLLYLVLATALLILGVVFKGYIMGWWYNNTDTEVPSPNIKAPAEYKKDMDWMDCVYECAQQDGCLQPGECIKFCDSH